MLIAVQFQHKLQPIAKLGKAIELLMFVRNIRSYRHFASILWHWYCLDTSLLFNELIVLSKHVQNTTLFDSILVSKYANIWVDNRSDINYGDIDNDNKENTNNINNKTKIWVVWVTTGLTTVLSHCPARK